MRRQGGRHENAAYKQKGKKSISDNMPHLEMAFQRYLFPWEAEPGEMTGRIELTAFKIKDQFLINLITFETDPSASWMK